jgi:ribosome-associated protein
MNTKEMADAIAKELSDRKAHDIVVIDISEKSSFADFFVNVTAGSDRQTGALLESVEEKAEELGIDEKGVEGRAGSGWLLVDLGDIIVNIFNEETRERYSLDRIWSDCETRHIEE